MVIFYDLNTNEIKYTEREVIQPVLPIGTTEEKLILLKEQNIGFVSVPYELDSEIFNYRVSFNNENNFIGLQPK